MLVLVNTDTLAYMFKDVNFPGNGAWKLVADIEQVKMKGLTGRPNSTIEANAVRNIKLERESLMIWIHP